MALSLLARSAMRAGVVCSSRVASARPAKAILGHPIIPQRSLAVSAAGGKQPAKAARPPPVEEDEYDEEAEQGDFDPMEDLNAASRRRVLAMKAVQKQYDSLHAAYQAELAQLQAKYNQQYAPLYDERREIYMGKKPITEKYDVEDDGEPDGPVPDFWLNALANHDKVGPYITERDSEVLKYLEDVRCEVLTGEERGFKLTFYFAENPFFTNKTLEKLYVLEPEDDVVPKRFTGTKINWKAGMDVTVEEQKRRVKGGKGDKGKPAFVVETVPCDSFFTIFDPPKMPTEAESASMRDEELEELEEALTNDFDVGFAIKDQLIPRAVEWFTGEIAPLQPEDYDEGYEDDEY